LIFSKVIAILFVTHKNVHRPMRFTELRVPGTELASCHPSDAKNLKIVPRFLENSWTPVLRGFHDLTLRKPGVNVYIVSACLLLQARLRRCSLKIPGVFGKR